MAKVRIDINDIRHYTGCEIGVSGWVRITQDRVNKFAGATGDFQWLHVDEEQARTGLPTGRTIVHNFLLLSLVPQLFDQTVAFSGLAYGLNKGAENIAFLQPLFTDSEVRIRVTLSKLEYSGEAGQIGHFEIIMEQKGGKNAVLTMGLRLLLVADAAPPRLADQQQSVAL